MDFFARSDLARESLVLLGKEIEGTRCTERQVEDFCIFQTEILTDEAEKEIGKPKGFYTTIECGKIHLLGSSQSLLLVDLLAEELSKIVKRQTGKAIDSELRVFVAGLGNEELTADAIGPKCIKRLTATSHLRDHEHDLFFDLGCSALSMLSPGVLGQTGIETLDLLKGAVQCVHPDVVVVIDALAARSCDRLASTVQICDVGIKPGSGVGNHRAEITRESLGVPVIVIGVPTVVHSATLVYDALREAGIEKIEDSLKHVLSSERSFFVSPKECDVIVERFSELLADAIGITFHTAFL